MSANPKPLSATIAERLGLPKPTEPPRRPAPQIGPPPSSAQLGKLHQLPPPSGPERSFVEAPSVPEKDKRGRYDLDFKAKVVKEALEAKAAGKPAATVAKKHGIGDSLLSQWLLAASGKKPGKKRHRASSDDAYWATVVTEAKRLMAAGKNQRQIAKKLKVSPSALSRHLQPTLVSAPVSSRAPASVAASADWLGGLQEWLRATVRQEVRAAMQGMLGGSE